jgi:hypothetical protein
MKRWLIAGLLLAASWPGRAQIGSFIADLDDEALGYTAPAVRDPVALLQKRLDRGEVRLEFTRDHGYLESVMKLLNLPVSSQTLVFSKTSFQLTKISPATPRALYFNDNVYLGFVQNGDVMEASAVDPEKGAIFYSLDQKQVEKPRFTRRVGECLQCHASPNTHGIPGHQVRSVYPDRDGQPLLTAGFFLTDHRSPFQERWGGWYVTGTTGRQAHMGNVFAKDPSQPEHLNSIDGLNVTSLKGIVNTAPYLSPHSDVVALMVLEHQTQMHNLITRVGYEARLALSHEQIMDEALGRQPGEGSETTRRRIERPTEILLRYTLFAEEAPLEAPVKGTSQFRQEFEALGPQDRRGRSLRQMDLQKRVFRYPCSYLIYTAAFDALPREVQDRFYRRLWEVLSGKDQSADYKALSAADRQAVLEILRETKKGLPSYFGAGS